MCMVLILRKELRLQYETLFVYPKSYSKMFIIHSVYYSLHLGEFGLLNQKQTLSADVFKFT